MNDTKLPTVIEKFYHWEKTTPDNVFLRQPKGDVWTELSFAEAGLEARKMVTALRAQGLKPGSHIGIYSKNCYHWILADLAIMMGGYVSVPFYSSLPGDQLAQVIEMADLKALFIGKLESWDSSHSDAIQGNLISINFPLYAGQARGEAGLEWNDLIDTAEPYLENDVPDLNDLWTIKFTSGTTGTPKGVMHAHRSPALIMERERETNWIGIFKVDRPKHFSYLPLNHVGERIGVELPAIWQGGSISFAESLETFAANIQNTQPTTFFAVPRIWTNFYFAVLAKLPEKRLKRLLKLPILSSITKKKIRTGLGLADVKTTATGAAITPAFIKEFYRALDIHLIEAYGMTEVCGSITNSPSLDAPSDSVGRAVPGAEVKIDPDTSEVLMKSPYMMTGYYKAPEKTAEVLKDGWLHSGDIGELDEHGYLRIVGRLKDAFKTSKGSYVTPNPLEEVLSGNDYIDQVCVAGLGIPQPIALINLSPSGLETDRDDVEKSILQTLTDLNATRANFERISTVVIQSEAWSPDNDFLTPTLKVKRQNLDKAFSAKYLDWHGAAEPIVWT